MKLKSASFEEGVAIPVRHTCDGADVSPPLEWSGAPPAVKTFALICDDPDAPAKTWVHWVLFNLPAATARLNENVPKAELLDDGARQGTTDFGRVGYGGPCPPPGKPHRYFFRLYALDRSLDLKPGTTKAEVERAIKGHVLAEAQLMGTYGRKR